MIRKMALPLLVLLAVSPARAAVTAYGLDKNSYTSDFMIGNVAVAIIFPESDGTLDPNQETWSEPRKAQVVSEIMSGLNWWVQQNQSSSLSFTYVTHTVATRYEPITRPYYDEALWIPDVMSKLGYNGTRFTATRNFVNAMRTAQGADWGFVIFVADSLNDSNGKFSDGLFAYAYLGGPFLVLTYDNNGYGISNMDVVAAHETGHIFHALDQYAGGSGPNDYSYGYFSVINGNHAWAPTANTSDSIMRGGIRWGLDSYAKNQIGWRDSNNNGRHDIVDQTPTVQMLSQSSSSGGSDFTGQATVNILPRQNHALGYGLTVDTIAKVEYKVGSIDWEMADAADGAFNGPSENFSIAVPAGTPGVSALALSAQDLSVRATTEFALLSGGGSGSTAAASTLDGAHAFPNPFKPNSGLNHTNVTFTGLTTGAKVRIFTPAGEPVFDGDAPGTTGTLTWNAVNDEGQEVASGVYLYLITDTEGNKKEGKLAVIR